MLLQNIVVSSELERSSKLSQPRREEKCVDNVSASELVKAIDSCSVRNTILAVGAMSDKTLEFGLVTCRVPRVGRSEPMGFGKGNQTETQPVNEIQRMPKPLTGAVKSTW